MSKKPKLGPCRFCGGETVEGYGMAMVGPDFRSISCEQCKRSIHGAAEFSRWMFAAWAGDYAGTVAEVELLRRHIAEQDQALKEKEGELSRWTYSFIDVERERDEERAEVDRLRAELAARRSMSRLLAAAKAVALQYRPGGAYIDEIAHDLAVAIAGHESAQPERPGAVRYTGFIRRDQVLHLYESAEDMRAVMSEDPVTWSESCWLKGVVFHKASQPSQATPPEDPGDSQ